MHFIYLINTHFDSIDRINSLKYKNGVNRQYRHHWHRIDTIDTLSIDSIDTIDIHKQCWHNWHIQYWHNTDSIDTIDTALAVSTQLTHIDDIDTDCKAWHKCWVLCFHSVNICCECHATTKLIVLYKFPQLNLLVLHWSVSWQLTNAILATWTNDNLTWLYLILTEQNWN